MCRYDLPLQIYLSDVQTDVCVIAFYCKIKRIWGVWKQIKTKVIRIITRLNSVMRLCVINFIVLLGSLSLKMKTRQRRLLKKCTNTT